MLSKSRRSENLEEADIGRSAAEAGTTHSPCCSATAQEMSRRTDTPKVKNLRVWCVRRFMRTRTIPIRRRPLPPVFLISAIVAAGSVYFVFRTKQQHITEDFGMPLPALYNTYNEVLHQRGNNMCGLCQQADWDALDDAVIVSRVSAKMPDELRARLHGVTRAESGLPSSISLAHSIIELAHHLELRVIVEGVEKEPAYLALEKYGCDIGQRNDACLPLPSDEWMISLRANCHTKDVGRGAGAALSAGQGAWRGEPREHAS